MLATVRLLVCMIDAREAAASTRKRLCELCLRWRSTQADSYMGAHRWCSVQGALPRSRTVSTADSAMPGHNPSWKLQRSTASFRCSPTTWVMVGQALLSTATQTLGSP